MSHFCKENGGENNGLGRIVNIVSGRIRIQ